MNQTYDQELTFAKELAAKAREIALQYYKTDLDILVKSDESPVTIADKTINDMVIDSVKSTFPDHGVLGEENSFGETLDQLWVCDPIDGTLGFAMGEPVFTFSLALVIDGAPVVAVTCDIVHDRLFWATKGGGSYIDGKKCGVSSRNISEARLALSPILSDLYEYEAIYKACAEAALQTGIIQGCVFKGMLIAEGLADGWVWPSKIGAWDIAAIKLIVEEAGGRMTAANGEEQKFNHESAGVVVSNGIIQERLLQIVVSN